MCVCVFCVCACKRYGNSAPYLILTLNGNRLVLHAVSSWVVIRLKSKYSTASHFRNCFHSLSEIQKKYHLLWFILPYSQSYRISRNEAKHEDFASSNWLVISPEFNLNFQFYRFSCFVFFLHWRFSFSLLLPLSLFQCISRIPFASRESDLWRWFDLLGEVLFVKIVFRSKRFIYKQKLRDCSFSAHR